MFLERRKTAPTWAAAVILLLNTVQLYKRWRNSGCRCTVVRKFKKQFDCIWEENNCSRLGGCSFSPLKKHPTSINIARAVDIVKKFLKTVLKSSWHPDSKTVFTFYVRRLQPELRQCLLNVSWEDHSCSHTKKLPAGLLFHAKCGHIMTHTFWQDSDLIKISIVNRFSSKNWFIP